MPPQLSSRLRAMPQRLHLVWRTQASKGLDNITPSNSRKLALYIFLGAFNCDFTTESTSKQMASPSLSQSRNRMIPSHFVATSRRCLITMARTGEEISGAVNSDSGEVAAQSLYADGKSIENTCPVTDVTSRSVPAGTICRPCRPTLGARQENVLNPPFPPPLSSAAAYHHLHLSLHHHHREIHC